MPKREKPLPKSFWEDDQWIIDHYDELARQYADEWVAVVDGKVVASGKSMGVVEKTAEKKARKRHIPVMFIEKGVHIYGTPVAV